MKQLLILFATVLGLSVNAQNFTGSWEVFPNYSSPSVLVETPEYVYTLAGTSLIGYDKASGELAAYNAGHRLNGNAVKGIWYDPQEKYLFVTYTDYNIDLVFDDGRTVNVPDLRDAAINTDKTINGVAFYDGKAYVASNSGLLVVDARHGAIIESCQWGKQVNQIGVTPEKILIHLGGSRWYVGNREGSHHNFDKAFVESTSPAASSNRGILSAHGKITYLVGTDLYQMKINDEAANNAAAIVTTEKKASGVEDHNFQVTVDGFIAAGNGKVHRIDSAGNVTSKDVADTKSNLVAGWTDKTLWLANAAGLASVEEDGAVGTRLKPNGTSGSNVGIFRQAPDGTVYMSTVGVHQNGIAMVPAWNTPTKFDLYSDGKLTKIESKGIKNRIWSFCLNPMDNEIFISYYSTGISRINMNSQATYDYDLTNTTFPYASVVCDVAIGADGCLYALHYAWGNDEKVRIFKALPGSWETVSDKNGWSYVEINGLKANLSSRMILDESRNNIVVGGHESGIAVVKLPHRSEPFTSTTHIAVCSLETDEDGASFGGWKNPTLALDKNGWIWGGNDAGVYVIKNSDDMFNPGWAPMRPKVPRNDGTNLADYLLDNVEVFNIAVDENNEKWISTLGSGLYHVSADGSDVIEHFTTDNSQLLSDNVFASLPDKYSNKIFVGTDQGLAIYNSTSAPAKSDLKNVYAYPNPVTPEYTGYINIAGLMDGSLVKIADAAGNVFFQGKSSGGMLTWNGCDSSGRRVKSGVYYVFASKSVENSNSDACVTKIVVVN